MERTPTKSQHITEVNSGEENDPAAPVGTRTRNLSIMNPPCHQLVAEIDSSNNNNDHSNTITLVIRVNCLKTLASYPESRKTVVFLVVETDSNNKRLTF